MLQRIFGSYRVAAETVVVVAVLVAIRALLWQIGIEGMSVSALASSIVGGGVFVMGLVVAGTLADYRDAERAPTDLAAGLYAILRECESMHTVWGKPHLPTLRKQLIAVVTNLRLDINAGNSRDCQAAIEDLSQSFLELENTDVPANYIVRLRGEQAGLRKSLLRIYHIQREEFLPSAYAMIVSLVVVILGMVLFTNFEGLPESLVTLGFLSFFFLYLLRLLNVIDRPFKVGSERTDDDVSLFLLHEFVVRAQLGDAAVEEAEAMEEQVAQVEAQMIEVEEQETEAAAKDGKSISGERTD
ncbi:hypothetical protein DM872_10430 [Pseudomonas taiwanensis]|uniref:hypothetical protein n=1 Tax=Pseudomonas taiwanensis TaxID=470150 RepID=UPI0015BC0999|nr:hypothetical protein [Pseudomonas taiwanensis]NWL77270.1 hypothetical protein [Pseudomonas taiwanensis]